MNFLKQFGEFPDNSRKSKYHSLPNYKDGQFQNLMHTPALKEGKTMVSVLWEFLKKHPETEPKKPIPFVKTDLKNLDKNEDVFIWFGHSSYFLQIGGKRFLIDPVFSGNASPIPGSVKAFSGSNYYQPEHFPEIDYLLISHDHWDHLDYSTIQKLKPKIKTVICGLGVGQHFEFWGWSANQIIEKNWYEHVDLGEGFRITLTPARHFSGRLLSRNISLWTSYVLETPKRKIFLGGDSGYGDHFKEIGKRFGPFDFAIMECGQYHENWHYIHSLPSEILTEVEELNTNYFIPVHNSKFKLAQHPWYEPLQDVTRFAEQAGKVAVTPKIGDVVNLDRLDRKWEKWWEPIML